MRRKPTKPTIKKEYIHDGIKFDSNLEIYCYKKLKENGIKFDYHPKTFELIPAFTSKSESYEPDKRIGNALSKKSNRHQSIKYTPDFAHPEYEWIIETKGHANESFPLRWKLFKKHLTDEGVNASLFMPSNHLQVDQTINLIKNGY